MMKKLLVILLAMVALSQAAPPTYDQRQDGQTNVRVDLDNFLFFVAQPVQTSDVLTQFGQLFAERNAAGVQEDASKDQDSELKSIPDNEEDKSKDLEDVSLDQTSKVQEKPKEEVPAMKDKVIVLVQDGEKAARSFGEVIRTLRNLKAGKEVGLKGKYKFVESVDEPQNLKLVGDGIENCGPGRSRDRMGICQGDRIAEE